MKKIFVVDDEVTVLEYVKTALQNLDYQIFCADNAEEGIKRITEEKPDLILLDIMLPDMDGISVCRKLRSGPVTKDIPIIILTSLSDAATIQNAFFYGAADFMPKPFDLKILKSKIEKALQKSGKDK